MSKLDEEILEEFESALGNFYVDWWGTTSEVINLQTPDILVYIKSKGGDGRAISSEDIKFFIEEALKRKEEEMLEVCAQFILPKVQKFIDKVENGRARSRETYKEMKEVRSFLQKAKEEGFNL